MMVHDNQRKEGNRKGHAVSSSCWKESSVGPLMMLIGRPRRVGCLSPNEMKLVVTLLKGLSSYIAIRWGLPELHLRRLLSKDGYCGTKLATKAEQLILWHQLHGIENCKLRALSSKCCLGFVR